MKQVINKSFAPITNWLPINISNIDANSNLLQSEAAEVLMLAKEIERANKAAQSKLLS